MDLIEQCHELFVIVKDVALLPGGPVHIYLIGILAAVGVIFVGGLFHPRLLAAVGHDKQLPEIVPFQPDRQQMAAVVDAVGNLVVQINDVLDGLVVGLDNLDAVL